MTNRQKLEADCRSLCRKIVMKRDGYVCRVQGCNRTATDTIHIIDRDVNITTFDLTNLYAGCRIHHDHGHPLDLIKQHISVAGEVEVFRLSVLAQQYKVWYEIDLEELKVSLKQELERIKT